MKLLINNEYRKLLPDKLEKDINISQGIIKKNEYNKIKEGIIKTHKGSKLLIKKPDFKDLFMNIKRGPQIITLKDAGIIASSLGIMKDFMVLDCGGGSGALTCFFANITGSKGKIISIEKKPEFCKIIKKNAELFGFKNVQIINKDLDDYSQRKKFDAMNLDLPNPQDYASKANEID
ncbi:MAG: methyltransferase domain-containing protein, partial [Candidatus Nanoarchaeia archaeon]|nr:methyltransferase domain-containing protein [Candidatus Nanoarchaeia archaeon]